MDKNKWPTGIRPSGNGLRIRIWKKGKLVYSETVEGSPFDQSTVKAAVKRREDLLSRQRLGLPLSDEEEEPEVELFWEAAQDYLNTLDAKKSTVDGYTAILNHYWLPEIGTHFLHKITRAKVKRILADLNISHKTKKNILIPLRGVFEHRDIESNPATVLKRKRVQKAPIQRYRPEERDALINVLQGQAKVYFAILFACGLRPGEALALTWADYDGEELNVTKQITKRRLEPTTKTYMARRVYVPQWARALLDSHVTRFKGGHIFLNTVGTPHLDTDRFNEAWRSAHKKAKNDKGKKGIPYRIPYTCRHTRAAELLSTGVEPAAAAKQLGHSLEMFFRTYAEWIEEFGKQKDNSRFEGFEVAAKKA